MRVKKAPILLLTACVNPGGMSFTVLQDPDVRMQQYAGALRYYIANTDLRIVFCENTGYDMSDRFAREISDGRLECLTFEGNNYNRSLGKGYGEALIIRHALHNSLFINDSDGYIIKITGRIIVENITDIIRYANGHGGNFFSCNITEVFFFQSVVMMFHPSYFKYIIDEALYRINDSAIPPRYLEIVLAELISKNKEIKIKPYLYPPVLKGISATYNSPYTNKNERDNAIDNLVHLSNILNARGQYIQSLLCKVRYFYLIAKYKLLKC